MRKTLAALAAAAAFGAHAAPESYTIDPTHTYPNFAVSHWGFSTMHGQFQSTTGKVVIDRAARTLSADIAIDAKSINTGFGKRDEHLRSPDFFNVAEHPRITFKSTGSKWEGDRPVSVDGTMTMLGVSRPVTLTLTSFRCGEDPRKAQRCGGDATATIKRSDFGMKYAIPAVGDDIRLMFEIEAVKD